MTHEETNDEDSDDTLQRLADSLVHLSDEQRQIYIDLQQTPYDRQTAEMKEMVERLVMLGHGLSGEQVDRFLEIKTIPPKERSLEQQELVMNLVLQENPTPETISLMQKIVEVPFLRAKYRRIVNMLMVFPPRLHELLYREEVGRLQDEFQSLLDEYFGNEESEES